MSPPDHPWDTHTPLHTPASVHMGEGQGLSPPWPLVQAVCTPPLPATGQGLTPRELLERRLEWGEPLRSRDTCFRTSAATVLRRQEGGVGNKETQAGVVGEWG